MAKGEADLVTFLKEETGRSESALKKSLKVELDAQDAARFCTACQGDEALWQRVEPLAGLVRPDSFGYPVVIPKGSVFVTAGTDRRSSGTHYTPRSLTEPIVQYTLEPLVYVGPAEGKPKGEWKLKSAKELLELKICDMACGSGAFLVQAARYLAERLLEAWDEAKQANPNTPGITPEGTPSTGKTNEALIPDDPAERKTYAMRIIAQRCLYGVDKNPLAAEMAKLSLWLLTLAKDKPFEFLDHSIRCGDSLVGLHDIEQLRHYSLKPDADDAVLFKGPLDSAVDEAIHLRLKLEDLPANTVEDVERQEELLREANDKIARLRCAADLLVAAEFWGENAKDKLERVRHNAVRSGYYVDKGPTEEFEQVAAKERRRQLMFHWPLEFPEVIVKRGGFDAFVGNPPFMGGKKISGQYGVPYREFLVDDIANGSKGNADICSYFFLRASTLTRRSGTFGFVATNTICQGDTREVGLDAIVDNGFSLIQATPSAIWPGNASVQVAKVWSYFGPWNAGCVLNDLPVSRISSYLTEPGRLEGPPKRLIVNSRKSYQGAIILGTGFTMAPKEAEDLISREPKYGKVLFPFLNGVELNSSPTQQASRWVINFYDWPLSHDTAPSTYSGPVAADFPVCLEIVRKHVKPERDLKDRKVYREIWWQYAEKQTALFRAIAELKSVIVVAATSKTLAFAIVPNNCVFSNALYVFCSDDPALFAVLMGEFKRAWTFEYCSNMRTDLRYSNSDAFETFPFPTLDRRLASVGSKHSEYRSDIMVNRSEGLTATYNRFHDPDETSADIQKLRELHVEMDQAVAAAYGWTDLNLDHDFHETKQGVRFTISEAARREVLQRLLKLNHERYAEEVKQGLHGKSAKSTSKSGRGRKQKDPVVVASGEPEQQDMF